jgi:hypothetical protein
MIYNNLPGELIGGIYLHQAWFHGSRSVALSDVLDALRRIESLVCEAETADVWDFEPCDDK